MSVFILLIQCIFFFITGLHHLQLLLEGNRVVHVARQHVLRDFSWALHIRPVFTGAAPCSPFWWSWWRCWWTHQRPIFNILGSSLQRVFPWRQYLCTFPTHSQVSRLRSIPDTWPYSDSRSCSDWNHSYTTEPVLHQRQCWSMTFSCILHPSKDKSPRQHYRISVRYQRGT